MNFCKFNFLSLSLFLQIQLKKFEFINSIIVIVYE